jgi:hypothetical protein
LIRTALEAELALNDLCNQHHAVGFLNDNPIRYDLLLPFLARPSDQDMAQAGWSPAEQRSVELAVREQENNFKRLRGIAGWLLTEPGFLDAAKLLREQWAALPEAARPQFPLQRGSFLLDARTNCPRELSSDAHAAFTVAFVTFCDRWGLTGMCTWGLPEPQGLLFANPLPQDSVACPRHGIHIVVPICFPIQGNDDFVGKIAREQRALAQESGIDLSGAGLPHADLYARMLDVIHIERTAIGRYGPATKHPGLIDALKDAMAETLDVTPDRVGKLRKVISACWRGRRDSVAALNTRA